MSKTMWIIFTFVLGLGYLVGNFYPILGHEMPAIVEYVEIQVESKKIIEVPQYQENYTILLENNTVIDVGGYKLYENYFGLCNNTYDVLIYENESWYWETSYAGCLSSQEVIIYYLFIDEMYLTIEYAIDNNFITTDELDELVMKKKPKV